MRGFLARGILNVESCEKKGGADDGWTIVSGFSIPLFPNLFVVAVETSQISNFSSAFLQSLAKKKVENI